MFAQHSSAQQFMACGRTFGGGPQAFRRQELIPCLFGDIRCRCKAAMTPPNSPPCRCCKHCVGLDSPNTPIQCENWPCLGLPGATRPCHARGRLPGVAGGGGCGPPPHCSLSLATLCTHVVGMPPLLGQSSTCRRVNSSKGIQKFRQPSRPPRASGQLAAVHNLDDLGRPAAAGAIALHLLHHIHALHNGAEDDVLAVEPACGRRWGQGAARQAGAGGPRWPGSAGGRVGSS